MSDPVLVRRPLNAHRGKGVLQPRRSDVRVPPTLGADRKVVVHRGVHLAVIVCLIFTRPPERDNLTATQPEVAPRRHQVLAAWRVGFDSVAGDAGGVERTNKAADSNSVWAPGAISNERESPWACGQGSTGFENRCEAQLKDVSGRAPRPA